MLERIVEVLLEPGCYNLLNMGGVAMMHVAITRMRERWPGVVIRVITDDAAALERHFPGTVPVVRRSLGSALSDGYLFGWLNSRVPAGVARRFEHLQRRMRSTHTRLLQWATFTKMRFSRDDAAPFRDFIESLNRSDAVVISGAGGLNDEFPGYIREVSALVEGAASRGLPAGVFGQGVGPLDNQDLRARLGRALSRAELVGVREPEVGVRLVEELGVAPAKVTYSGDCAIELAVQTPEGSRSGLGVNVRLARYASLDGSRLHDVAAAVRDFSAGQSIPLLPVPIGLHAHAADHIGIRDVLSLAGVESDGGASLDTPERVLAQVANCRVVLTGAYHAAVFALAQGIPAVCLATSPLYLQKFEGLARTFGAGCVIVDTDSPDFTRRLGMALESAWGSAPRLRDELLAAARAESARSRKAYSQFFDRVDASSVRRPARRRVAAQP